MQPENQYKLRPKPVYDTNQAKIKVVWPSNKGLSHAHNFAFQPGSCRKDVPGHNSLSPCAHILYARRRLAPSITATPSMWGWSGKTWQEGGEARPSIQPVRQRTAIPSGRPRSITFESPDGLQSMAAYRAHLSDNDCAGHSATRVVTEDTAWHSPLSSRLSYSLPQTRSDDTLVPTTCFGQDADEVRPPRPAPLPQGHRFLDATANCGHTPYNVRFCRRHEHARAPAKCRATTTFWALRRL